MSRKGAEPRRIGLGRLTVAVSVRFTRHLLSGSTPSFTVHPAGGGRHFRPSLPCLSEEGRDDRSHVLIRQRAGGRGAAAPIAGSLSMSSFATLCGSPPKAGTLVVRGIVAPDRVPDTVRAAMRRLLCFLVGHKPGKRVIVTGIQVRTCTRCGRAI